MTTIEELRTNFRTAYEAYIREGCEMRDLLTTDGLDAPERLTAIEERQARVDIAKAEYDRARTNYVEYVLANLAGSGGSLL